jgi:phosphoribosylanthranilate isomerase
MWVKICGNTTLEDAEHATRSGANALGFIFAPSPRRVTADLVAAITRLLPAGAEHVGVFGSHNAVEIAEAAETARLTTIQLHGGFDLPLLQQFEIADRFELIQVLHWAAVTTLPPQHLPSHDTLAETLAQLRSIAELSARSRRRIRVLIDSKAGARTGGTGTPYDWKAAAELFRHARQLGIDAIAAGGLSPENVPAAIDQLAPWGVDVSSGVEREPGRKDPAAVAQFLARAHGVQKP